MQYMVVGIFGNYAAAEAAVSDLESAGLGGEQVEIIGNIDEDARTANTPGEPLTMPREPHQSRIAHFFGAGGPLAKPDVRDLAGDQPNYIGEQEFYATHVKEGGAVLIVRTQAEPPASRAAAILKDHGARTPGRKDGPSVRRVD